MQQLDFASLIYLHKKKKTRKELFLADMEKVFPWTTIEGLLKPFYHREGKRGGQPKPLTSMLRIYLLQQWYALSDPAMEDALYEIESMRRFAGLSMDDIPDESTILHFRHFLEKHNLTSKVMNAITDHLEKKGVVLKGGTMVDATIIHAPASTKNKEKKRDPEMDSTKKANQYYFGMKIHVGADVNTRVVHTASITPANTADIKELPNLLREDDKAVFGDRAYVDNKYKRAARKAGVYWGVNLKAQAKKKLSRSSQYKNRRLSSIRARVEHVFRVIKIQFGYKKVRYRGIEKNASQVFMLIGLTNLYLMRKVLLKRQEHCVENMGK